MNDNENKTNAPIKLPDLLNCPFCNGEPRWWDRKDYTANYTVGCQNIDCFLWIPDDVDVRQLERYATCYRLADSALKAWNTRNEADALRSILADALVVIERSKGITESRADYDDLCTVRNRINAAIKPNAAAGEQKP